MAYKNNLEADEELIDFLKQWEYFVPYWYDDKVAPKRSKGKLIYPRYRGGPVKGTLTIGYGHTKAAKAHVSTSLDTELTEAEASNILDIDLDPCEEAVNKMVKVPLSKGQFRALVSAAFNFGEGTLKKSSIIRKLNAGDYAGARAAFDLYVYSDGERMTGLQRRRDAEQVMWDERDDLPKFMPEQGEIVEHPAEVEPPQTKSVNKTTEGITSLGQTVGGTGGIVKEGFDASDAADKVIAAKDQAEQLGVKPLDLFEKVRPMADYLIHSPTFWVCVAITAVGAYLYFRRWRSQQEGRS